jgi:hypothetical protein
LSSAGPAAFVSDESSSSPASHAFLSLITNALGSILFGVAGDRPLSKDLAKLFQREHAALAVGATSAIPLAHVSAYEDALGANGISLRDPERNRLLGMTVTRPRDGQFVLGLAYDDQRDHTTDEDAYIVDTNRHVVETRMKGALERSHPEYRGTHRGPKPYLEPHEKGDRDAGRG